MGVQIPPGYGQCSFVFSLVGSVDEMVTTLGYNPPAVSPPGVGDPTANAGTIRTNVGVPNTLFSPDNISSQYQFRGVRCTENFGTGPVSGESMAPSPGTLTAATVPSNCAVLVHKATTLGGRHGRGRMYLPPMFFGESDVDAAGNIAGIRVSAIQTLFNSFVAAMVSDGLQLVLLHSDDTEPTPITAFTVQGQLATQRGRMR